MKNLKTSKPPSKWVRITYPKFTKDLYFNPKRRKEIRESTLNAQKAFLETVETPTRSTTSFGDASSKVWAEKFLDQMGRMIDLIDNVVPRKLKETEVTNGSFKGYIKRNGKQIVLDCSYDKGIPKKHLRAYLVIPSGLPVNHKRTKAQLIRRAFDKKGYDFQDSGEFLQKLISFERVNQTYKGKKKTIKLFLTMRGKIQDDYWLKLM